MDGGQTEQPNKVREIRVRLGLAQQAVAVQAGMNCSSLTAIEKYGYCPGPEVRQKLARVLQVTETDLFPEQENSISPV